MRSKMKPMMLPCLVSVLVSSLVIGCGSNTTATNISVDDQTPVSLSIFAGSELTPDILDLVKNKFPNYTFTVITPGKGSQLSDLVAQDKVPDILDIGAYSLSQWSDLGLTYDLTPLINKYKVDLNRYNPQFIENIRHFSGSDGLVALPYYQWIDVLFYNKDLFNKFGVPYPKDGMTWNDLLDLEKKMTRTIDGTQYYGFFSRGYQKFAGQYPLLTVDPKTNQSIVTNPDWIQFMQFYKSLYQVPGMEQTAAWTIANGDDAFLQDKTMAMWSIGAEHTNLELKDATANGLNWDMAKLPTRPDSPEQGTYANGIVFGISPSSAHKDEAFKVIAYLGSDQVQDALSADGMPPAITNQAVLHDYGKNNPIMKGKNINAIVFKKFATYPGMSKYDGLAYPKLAPHVTDLITGKKDINTALAEAAQDIDNAVTTAKQQNK